MNEDDDNPAMLMLRLILVAVLLLMNALLVALDVALDRARMTRAKDSTAGNVSTKVVAHALKHLESYLSATQLGLTLTTLALGWLGGPLLAHLLARPLLHAFGAAASAWVSPVAMVIALLLAAAVTFVFGVSIPRAIATRHAEGTMRILALPLAVAYALIHPLGTLLDGMTTGILRLLRIKPGSERDPAHAEDELRMIITASGAENGGTLHKAQAELLDNVLDFAHRLARQVMVHRTEIEVLDANDPLEDNVRLAQQSEHTRYPVIDGDIDRVIGFVHTKDLFALYQRDPRGDLRTVIREILIVPENARVDLLLHQFQRRRQHMALLVDEYGGTAGMVTVADLLEELVGELPDEFEPAEEEWIIRTAPDTWSVDGRVPLGDLEEALEREVPCEEACDTVGGYAFWAFGRIPEVTDTVCVDGLTLRVTAMDGRRVSRVEIVVSPLSAEEALHAEEFAHNAR
ncbi:MAG: hemolysin family protein [Armatimonadota bacterium]